MNVPKVVAEDYIQFLVASAGAVSGTEAARVHLVGGLVTHDSFTRLLHLLEPDASALWQEVWALIEPAAGVLVLDDTTLNKPYARHMGLVTRHWSGKHHAVVQGINLLTLLWSNGQRLVPIDYCLYDKGQDQLTKNDHFRALLDAAYRRGLAPGCVLFDSWYASLANLKHVPVLAWRWLTRLKSNRLVRLGDGPLAAAKLVDYSAETNLSEL
ncbi:transposase [Hymenobacter koreensis]|uniref:Transposase IS701-like DDE domain-containing protein n=1 Tax=Hymenobacter koreensis TaxID=1084523 RepID=A0ABP8IZF0_9BACT